MAQRLCPPGRSGKGAASYRQDLAGRLSRSLVSAARMRRNRPNRGICHSIEPRDSLPPDQSRYLYKNVPADWGPSDLCSGRERNHQEAPMKPRVYRSAVAVGVATIASSMIVQAQMRDRLEKISGVAVGDGIQKNLGGQIGTGRGSVS